MSDDKGQHLSVPQWAAPALVALVLGLGGGYVGTREAAEPAVLAEGVARLRDDLAGLRGDVRDLTSKVDALSADRFGRSEHDAWVRTVYRPDVALLAEGVERNRSSLEQLRLELRELRATKEAP